LKNALRSTSDGALNGALDELYAAPFDRFMALRSELAGRLRAAGDAPAARQIANASKPTRTAWALNQVARRRPELLAAIVSSREAAAAAQKSGDSSEIRDGARRYRDAVGDAVQAVGSILIADGVPFSAAQARRVGETLKALAADEAERAKLTAGRLVRDVAVDDPFAGIEAGPPARRPGASESAQSERAVRGQKSEKATSGAKAKGRPDDELARAREAKRLRDERARAIEEARARVKALEASNAEARKAAAETHRDLVRAQHEADKAKRALAEVEQELESARAHLSKLPK
jgi:hypothetical protein